MAKQTELVVTRREVRGKAAKHLRKAGLIPANIYGHKEASEAVQVDAAAFAALRRAHKISSILALRMDGSSSVETTLVRHIQRNPINGKILHIDDTLHASDVKLPKSYKLITDPEEAIVKIAATRAEKAEEVEEAPAELAATSAAPVAPAAETSTEE